MREIITETISGKNIYIFEDHATALIPWAGCRQTLDRAPNLITLDFHTDTMTAFNAYLCLQEFDNPGKSCGETREDMCAKIDYRSAGSINRAVEKLRNDEHIAAAVSADIIDYAFVVSYDGRGLRATGAEPRKRFRVEAGERQPNGVITLTLSEAEVTPEEASRKKARQIPNDKMIVIDWEEGFEYERVEITEEDTRRHSDLALESDYLNAKLNVADEICQALGQTEFLKGKYILDIDLDYFRTARAIEPRNARTFYELVRGAEIITVALEPQYVIWERLKGETITSEWLLTRLLGHFRSALG